jgi:hypothetical protein
MKTKLSFLAITLIAVTSAFTIRPVKTLAHRYHNIVSIDFTNNRYQLLDASDIITLLEGTESGQYTCYISSEICTLETDSSAFQIGGVWFVSFSKSEIVTEGTLVLH